MNIWKAFEIAAEAAISKDDRRSFSLGACGIRGDGAVVKAANAPTIQPDRKVHAEYRLSQKLDVGAIVYVARVSRKDGSYEIAKPCFSCEKVLRSRGVKKIYYTISGSEYGCIDLRRTRKFEKISQLLKDSNR